MRYTHIEPDGRKIECFLPEDTPTTMYIDATFGNSLADILTVARAKWGKDIDVAQLSFTAEHIHTSHLGYDRYERYDASDYTNYIVVTLER